MIYRNVNTDIGTLLSDIYSGRLGLPSLQRPFVWANFKIKNLYDSLIKGFPIGHIMIWQAPSTYTKTRQIGTDTKNEPIIRDIVIDGQQRLTALYATMYGIEIINKDYKHCRIKISYNPYVTGSSPVIASGYNDSFEYFTGGNCTVVDMSKVVEYKLQNERGRHTR